MRLSLVLAASLAFIAAPSFADTAVQAAAGTAAMSINANGQMLRSGDNARIGRVSRVGQDGTLEVIVDAQVRLIPASTVSVVDGKLTTSLTKQQIISLR